MSDGQAEFGQTLFSNLLEIFVRPAIERRQASGELPKPMELQAAQIVFFPDSRPHVVRVNSEVRAEAKVTLKAGVRKAKGEPILENEVEGLQSLALPANEVDCGHATLIRLHGLWGIYFDFTYNKGLAQRHIDAAQEFLDTASDCRAAARWIAFLDSLFSAASLAMKATLLSVPDPRLRERANHKAIRSRVNRWAHLGSLPEDHRDVFNKLFEARLDARYMRRDTALTPEEADVLFDAVTAMLATARSRHPAPDTGSGAHS